MKIVSIAVVVVGVIGLKLGSAASHSASSAEGVDSRQLKQAIRLSADYLIRICDQNGKFLYRINLDPKVTPKPKYNFLRHAGSMYALSQYEQAYPNQEALQAIERAALFLKKAAIAPIPGRNEMLAVWSVPAITGIAKPVQAKLGGNGLGLVALLSLERKKPGSTSIDYLRSMGKFIVFMQKNDGSFYSKYMPHDGGKSDKWTSLYYPGEAALGLLMLYERDPNSVWLQAAANAIAYLARKRAANKSAEADHWALLATARLLPLYDRCRQPVPPSALIQHAIQICNGILESKARYPKDALEYGCLTYDGRTTPTSIRLEGLLAAYGFLPEANSALRDQIGATANEGISFLLRSQIHSGEHAGAIPRAIRMLPENHPQFTKSNNKRATEVRIDYVQHALSAMIQYEKIFF